MWSELSASVTFGRQAPKAATEIKGTIFPESGDFQETSLSSLHEEKKRKLKRKLKKKVMRFVSWFSCKVGRVQKHFFWNGDVICWESKRHYFKLKMFYWETEGC